MSQQINLFNPIFRQQKKYLSAATMAQALGLILLGALLVGAYAGYRLTAIKGEAAGARSRLIEAQERLARASVEYAPRQKDPELEAELTRAEAELAALQKVADILRRGELGSTQGYAEYWRAFARQAVPGLWLTGLRIHGAGAEIGLQGRALNPELIPGYIGRLKNEAVLKGKSFSMLEMHLPRQRAPGQEEGVAQETAAAYIEFSLRSSGIAAPAEKATEAQDR